MSDAETPVVIELTQDDMPALYVSTDEEAIKAQRSFFRIVKAQIAALLIAALAATIDAAVDGQTWLAYVAVGALVGLAMFRVWQRYAKFETLWYEGRAGAEAIGTLTWRYSVAAAPFDLERDAAEADRIFLQRIHESLGDLPSQLFVPRRNSHDQITPAMRQMRSSSYAVRRESYLVGRVDNQADWYSSKARWAQGQTRLWDGGFLAACGLAVVFGLLRIGGVTEVNLISVAGMIAAVIATWSGVRRFASMARAYSIAAQELLTIRSLLPTITEDGWSNFVDDVESSISKEHSLWRASRS